MIISKSEFKDVIVALREQYDYDKARTKKLSEIYGSDVMPSDNSRLTNQLFKMLHIQFPPKGGFCKIQCFCWELDFGRSVEVENGECPVDLLWEELKG